jgi:hypothetical protein
VGLEGRDGGAGGRVLGDYYEEGWLFWSVILLYKDDNSQNCKTDEICRSRDSFRAADACFWEYQSGIVYMVRDCGLP